jgi:predicted DNA-binding transcriptional regulator AlpA
MTDTDVIRTEMAKVMTRANPPIIMTLEDVAAVVGMSYNYVRNELQHQPDFPAKLDRFKQPRWSRESILEWAQVAI